jgi:hypothetical protein
VSRHEVLDPYVRQIMIRTFIDERRHGWSPREQVTEALPEREWLPLQMTEDRLLLLQALSAVPAGRAARRARPER